MKLFAPQYYKDFKCIADKCKHSCCIGWEIDIDGDTLEKYRSLKNKYAKHIISSIDESSTPHFKLGKEERCLHLNKCGLCNIILNVGEEYLCDICREHPRFYHNTSYGREVGLGMSCEEACRLILSSNNYSDFVELGDICDDVSEGFYDSLSFRKEIYEILSEEGIRYEHKLLKLYSRFGVRPSLINDMDWHNIISSLEYLNPSHKDLFLNYSSDPITPTEYEKALEHALAYFVFRHCTEVYDEDEFSASLGFAFFCERLLASLYKAQVVRSWSEMVNLAVALSEEIEYSEDNTYCIKSEFFQL